MTSVPFRTYAPAELTLSFATSEQSRITKENTFVFWGEGYTMESYLAWEEHAAKEEWGKAGSHAVWVLVPRNDPKTTTDILAQCKTYRRRALVRRSRGTDAAEEPQVEEVVGYGIGAVYTREERRRKGYARLMMRLLHYILAPPSLLPPFPTSLGLPPTPPSPSPSSEHSFQDATFSVLYSDIGPNFYASCGIEDGPSRQPGWEVQPGGDEGLAWVLPSNTKSGADGRQERREGGEGIEWLNREGVMALEGEMDGVVRRAFEGGDAKYGKVLGNNDDGKITFAFFPSGGTLSIHALRILLTLPSLPLPNANPSFGLRLPTTASSTTSISPPTLFYTLSTELKPHKTLLITFFSSPSIPWSAVLAAAAREGCGRIEIWGDRFGKDWPVEKGERARREDHLPAVAWYGPTEGKEIQWAFNEKYAWC